MDKTTTIKHRYPTLEFRIGQFGIFIWKLGQAPAASGMALSSISPMTGHAATVAAQLDVDVIDMGANELYPTIPVW